MVSIFKRLLQGRCFERGPHEAHARESHLRVEGRCIGRFLEEPETGTMELSKNACAHPFDADSGSIPVVMRGLFCGFSIEVLGRFECHTITEMNAVPSQTQIMQ